MDSLTLNPSTEPGTPSQDVSKITSASDVKSNGKTTAKSAEKTKTMDGAQKKSGKSSLRSVKSNLAPPSTPDVNANQKR